MPKAVSREGESRGAVGVAEPDESLGVLEQPIELGALEKALRPIKATVVYLGTNPNMSVAFPGVVDIVKASEDGVFPEIRTPLEEGGNSSYDFRRLDERRRPIVERQYQGPKSHLVGKPCLVIDHPVHLYELFMRQSADGSKEFVVLGGPKVQAELTQFFFDRARVNKRAAREHELVTKEG